MFVPLSLKDEESHKMLWRNQSPNSAFYTRPLLLIAEKENHELLRFVNETFELQEKNLEQNDLTFQCKNKRYNVKITIEATMKDMKVRMAESGLGGAQCLIINRTAEKTLTLYSQLVDNDGNILKRKNDYDIRTGLTSELLSINDQHFITITHQYINGTTWVLSIMAHMRADIFSWIIRGKDKQERILKENKTILETIQSKIGLRLDQYNSSSSTTGGASTTGGQ
ncbi:unnamed protein product [Rotaria sp. Silwood2]|nr:unnamed protein product [Rotaria sp. Silwood2]CAF4599080.1 unnamed protein product [Rotaria sp. Silwood2]